MAKQVGTMEFWYKDYTEDEFNESVDCSFEVWGNSLGGMTMEQYYGFVVNSLRLWGLEKRRLMIGLTFEVVCRVRPLNLRNQMVQPTCKVG